MNLQKFLANIVGEGRLLQSSEVPGRRLNIPQNSVLLLLAPIGASSLSFDGSWPSCTLHNVEFRSTTACKGATGLLILHLGVVLGRLVTTRQSSRNLRNQLNHSWGKITLRPVCLSSKHSYLFHILIASVAAKAIQHIY